jgi:arabinogalactan oligomer/maltooligosaccharide transport system substrate-binding protein
MMKHFFFVLSLMLSAAVIFAGGDGEATGGSVNLQLWTQEGESEGAFQFVESLARAYTAANPNVTIEVLNKETEALREDFQTASLAGDPPDFVWTVNDHAGPFVAAELIQPVNDLFSLSKYVDSALAAATLDGKVWGVPITNGNHLMLLYNKELVPTPPRDTDELIEMGLELTGNGNYGLVWNQLEPFWLVPWLGGFGGSVFADDGKTPTLDTPEMVATLQFLHDLKYKHKIIPAESDYGGADTLFKEGKAAMIINGDWSLGDYKGAMGDKLGVARIPKVSSARKWPAPYTSGKFFMIASDLPAEKLQAVKSFIEFATSDENQLEMVAKLTRLPALKKALRADLITDDPILSGSSDQMVVGTPMPTVLEMRCNWDSMKPELNAVLADTKSPADAAKAMQAAALSCIKTLE